MYRKKFINIGGKMKNVKNDFTIGKNIGTDEVDPKLKDIVTDMLEKDNIGVSIKREKNAEKDAEKNALDPKLKALMNDINIDTKQIDTLMKQSDRKLLNEIPNLERTKPEKFKI